MCNKVNKLDITILKRRCKKQYLHIGSTGTRISLQQKTREHFISHSNSIIGLLFLRYNSGETCSRQNVVFYKTRLSEAIKTIITAVIGIIVTATTSALVINFVTSGNIRFIAKNKTASLYFRQTNEMKDEYTVYIMYIYYICIFRV